jgi:hypothetical protein
VLSRRIEQGSPRQRPYMMIADSAQTATASETDDNGVMTHVRIEGVSAV